MRFTGLAALLLSMTAITPAWAASPLLDALAAGRPVIDLRARYENVGDDSKSVQTGEAGTLRARLGYETGAWKVMPICSIFPRRIMPYCRPSRLRPPASRPRLTARARITSFIPPMISPQNSAANLRTRPITPAIRCPSD